MAQMERIPPHNDEAEKSVLGAILQDKEVFFQVSELVKAEDFYSPSHREIFNSMTDLYQRSEPIDIITVCDSLKRRNSLETVGGRAYIAELSSMVPTTANAAQYAKIVSQKAVLRRLIAASSEINEMSFSEKLDPQTVLDRAEQSIFEIAKTRQTNEYESLRQVLGRNLESIEEAQKNGGQLPGLATGYKKLDEKTTGLQPSDLIILAARPSMGKTAFAMNIAQYVAKHGSRVVIFSLEMSREQLGLRFLSMESRVTSSDLRTGNLSEENWTDINDAIGRLSDADIIIDDTPGIGVMEIRNKCRRIDAQKKIDLIIVDYMQIMSTDANAESQQLAIAMISKYLKQLAREMKCPVIALSQLSRASEKRPGGHRPMLSDLRDSGAIEQDADVVLFLHREDYYKDSKAEKDNICEVIIAKQRKGPTDSVFLTWLPNFTKFADREPEQKK